MDNDNIRLFESAGLKYTKEEDDLINMADTGTTKTISRASVISQLYSASLMDAALKEHAEALNMSAKASEKHEKSLTRATWTLFGATIALFIAAILPYIFNL